MVVTLSMKNTESGVVFHHCATFGLPSIQVCCWWSWSVSLPHLCCTLSWQCTLMSLKRC